MGYKAMIDILHEKGIKSPKGCERWSQSTLETMLTNEKYSGDSLLQKTLYGKSIKNHNHRLGRVNQYLVRNNHPGIISRDKYDMVQKIRSTKTKNNHKGEPHRISPYAYYFYSVDLGKYLTRIVEKHNKKYEVEMLLGIKNGQRVYFRFDYIKEGMMQMAKNLVDNKTTLTAKLKEMKKPTLAKLELEKARLYKSLEKLALSEKLETYGQISDVRLRIKKLDKLSEMIDDLMRKARKLSCEFDIILARELFPSFNVKEFTFFIGSPIGLEKKFNLIDINQIIFCIEKEVNHLYNKKTLYFKFLIA
jgi:hypothetical protein